LATPSVSASRCKTAPGLIAWMFALKRIALHRAATIKRASSYAALPYAPASWRGSRGRRSVSVN
jgi:hypothetical protein